MFLNNKKMIAAYIAIIFLVGLDRMFKILSIRGLYTEPLNILGNFFKLEFSKNYYIAFSIPLSGSWLNLIIILIITVLIYYFVFSLLKKKNQEILIYLPTIIIGAFSNLIDRIQYGYVIDYLDLKYFTVFNIADMMIVGGVIGLLLDITIEKKKSDSTE